MLKRRTALWVLLGLVSVFCAVASGAPRVSDRAVKSPSGNHEIEFRLVEGVPHYRVSAGETTVLEMSQMGLEVEGGAFGGPFEVDWVRRDVKVGAWEPVAGSMRSYPDSYHELVVGLREAGAEGRKLELAFRAYDEGVAFRYTVPEQEGVGAFVIKSERTEFQFTGDHHVYWDDYPQAKYERVKLSEMRNRSVRPLLVEAGERFVAIAEAGSLEHYAPMALSRNGEHRLVTVFRQGTVSASCPVSTPWRVVMVADAPGRLVERHYLLQNLSPPCALEDTSWIKPGKVWRSGLNTRSAKAIIDYAAANDYQYVHYDAGWYGPERDAKSDPLTVIDRIDLEEVIGYGKERGIGLICYINKIAMSDYDLDRTFRTYEEWGIRGVKFGFVNWQSQGDMEFLHRAIRKAAEYHLVVDIHDNYRLTGIERTYPNLLTVEGILGNEETAEKGNTPENVLTTAFARMIAGAGDYTPCYLNGRVVSRSFQLALGVVLYSPLQYLHWYDQADSYEGRSFPELEFWKAMPTTWDETKVVQGEIGEFITVARRKGDSWFVGSLTDGGRELEVPLDFLGEGAFTAKVYRESEGSQKEVSIEVIEVNSGSRVKARMGDGGGQAMWITPVGEGE